MRSESGRSDPLWDGKEFGANIARASRKDARDAVVAARGAQPGWWKTPAATRGLIVYRLAEMMEARRGELTERIREGAECSEAEAEREVTAAIDRTVWYAGWCDKYAALLSTRNPVGGPHFNFSSAEPMGVVVVCAPDRPALLGLVSVLLPPVVAGNAVVVVASEFDPRTAVVFAEALATSDIPAGVVNLLTGYRAEIAPVMAKHMDVNAIVVPRGDPQLRDTVERESAENVKRVRLYPMRSRDEWFAPSAQSLDDIAGFCEIKTIWHPAGV
ncbi:MAG TPA: aldehyde dehydrogenase family protein [Verrucomicrobiae bacterium]|nr:aldehyde dehydrogenase family protein [Verrucomicrobiae bacterium]